MLTDCLTNKRVPRTQGEPNAFLDELSHTTERGPGNVLA